MWRFSKHRAVATVVFVVASTGCGRTQTNATHASREPATPAVARAGGASEPVRTGVLGAKCTRQVSGTTKDGRPLLVYTEDSAACDRATTVALASPDK